MGRAGVRALGALPHDRRRVHRADLGTNLVPDGRASNSSDAVGVVIDTDGACYGWSGSVNVESTVGYRVQVAAADTKPRLRFHDTVPASYAA